MTDVDSFSQGEAVRDESGDDLAREGHIVIRVDPALLGSSQDTLIPNTAVAALNSSDRNEGSSGLFSYNGCLSRWRGVVMVAGSTCVILLVSTFVVPILEPSLTQLRDSHCPRGVPPTSSLCVLAQQISPARLFVVAASIVLYLLMLVTYTPWVDEARELEGRRAVNRRRHLRMTEEFEMPGPGGTIPCTQRSRDAGGPDTMEPDEQHRECSICLDSIQQGDKCRLLPCGHVFHTTCADGWLQDQSSCPSCRHDIRAPEDVPAVPEEGPNWEAIQNGVSSLVEFLGLLASALCSLCNRNQDGADVTSTPSSQTPWVRLRRFVMARRPSRQNLFIGLGILSYLVFGMLHEEQSFGWSYEDALKRAIEKHLVEQNHRLNRSMFSGLNATSHILHLTVPGYPNTDADSSSLLGTKWP